jgi:hypothetical protein
LLTPARICRKYFCSRKRLSVPMAPVMSRKPPLFPEMVCSAAALVFWGVPRPMA